MLSIWSQRCLISMLNKVALGSAQFGMKYGISNKAGKVPKENVFKILELAYRKGIHVVDTAYAYGESEEVIGEFISGSDINFDIVSKLPNLDSGDVAATERYFLKSLERLQQTKIYGYLVHTVENIIRHKEVWSRLDSLKLKGLVHKIGVSIYHPDELQYLWDNGIHFDIVQIPYNIFDQRFEEYLSDLKEKGIEIQARSIFLQGLFFLGADEINRNFQQAREGIGELRRISIDYKIPLHSLCLCFALLNPFLDKIIIGVDSIEQLEQNIASIGYLNKTRDIYSLLQSMRLHNEEIILPYNWNL